MNKMSRTGVYGISTKRDKILLITQQNGPYKGKYDFPGGGIEFGETIEEALRREFHEEVCMGFTSMKLLGNVTTLVKTEEYELHQIGLIYKINGLHTLDQNTQSTLPYTWVEINTLNKENASELILNALKKELL
jgi:hypothetical protein